MGGPGLGVRPWVEGKESLAGEESSGRRAHLATDGKCVGASCAVAFLYVFFKRQHPRSPGACSFAAVPWLTLLPSATPAGTTCLETCFVIPAPHPSTSTGTTCLETRFVIPAPHPSTPTGPPALQQPHAGHLHPPGVHQVHIREYCEFLFLVSSWAVELATLQCIDPLPAPHFAPR